MFEFSEEHRMVRKVVRAWAESKLAPKVDALEAGEPPYELMRDLAKTFGIASLVKESSGGDSKARDPSLSAILSIELSRVCPGFMLAFGASMGLAGGAIMGKGTPEQRKRWALPLLTFEKIGAWGMTEPGAGSDAFRSMRTRATPKDGGYVLDGQKTFITNAPYADTFVIYAKVGDGIGAFIVERGDKGIETSKPMRKMGMHSSPTGEVFLSDCFVPEDRVLASEGRSSGKDVFHSERTGMAPMCVGIIEKCLEIATAYAKQRVTWGQPIAQYQLVQEKLATMFVHLENCKNLMFKQLTLAGSGKSMSAAEASAAKLYCARAATESAMEAVQLLGGNGYMQEYRVEMLARDAKLLQIGGGTDEIQIINIARNLLT